MQMRHKGLPKLKQMLARFPRVPPPPPPVPHPHPIPINLGRTEMAGTVRLTGRRAAVRARGGYPNVSSKVTPRNFEGRRANGTLDDGKPSSAALVEGSFGGARIGLGVEIFPAARQKLPELVELGSELARPSCRTGPATGFREKPPADAFPGASGERRGVFEHWSHFLRQTGCPLWPKMLPVRGSHDGRQNEAFTGLSATIPKHQGAPLGRHQVRLVEYHFGTT